MYGAGVGASMDTEEGTYDRGLAQRMGSAMGRKSDDEHLPGFKVRLEKFDKATQRRLARFRADSGGKDKKYKVKFEDGPLGLKLSQVSDKVLVTHCEKNSQAEACGKIHFGNQVIAVGKVPCAGMSISKVTQLVTESPRPLVIEFRELVEVLMDDDEFIDELEKDEEAMAEAIKDIDPESKMGGLLMDKPNNEAISKFAQEVAQHMDVLGQNIGSCICTVSAKFREDNPFFTHFLLLCKAGKIAMLLDNEESTVEEMRWGRMDRLNKVNLKKLYESALARGVDFREWTDFIDSRLTNAYIDAADFEPQTKPPDELDYPSLPAPEAGQEPDDLCSVCKEIKSKTSGDDMYMHFYLLLEAVRSNYLGSSIAMMTDSDIQKLFDSCSSALVPVHEWKAWLRRAIHHHERVMISNILSGGP